jgi:hypothetical protein
MSRLHGADRPHAEKARYPCICLEFWTAGGGDVVDGASGGSGQDVGRVFAEGAVIVKSEVG